MSIRFETTKPNNGLDNKIAPNWLMVPLNGTKEIRLLDAVGLDTVPVTPLIADFTETADSIDKSIRILTIKGKIKGRTFIDVKKGNTIQKRLEVSVKRLKEIKVTFNFVEDSGGHKTKRTTAELDNYIKEINDIFLPQTNIKFTKHAVHNIEINKDLGKVVRFSSHLKGVPKKEHEWDLIVSKRDNKADFNIFFVWEYEQDKDVAKDQADAGTIKGNCIFEDQVGGTQVSRQIAHEVGHFLKRNDTYKAANIDRLMYGYTDGGMNIPKSDTNIMNP